MKPQFTPNNSAQSAPVPETAGDGADTPRPERTSGAVRRFRALLWKEWRQQRGLGLGLGLTALVLFATGGFGDPRSFTFSISAWSLVLVVIPIVLGSMAYSGETEDGTADFLNALPFERGEVFLAKFATVVALSWLGLEAMLWLTFFWDEYPANALDLFPRLLLSRRFGCAWSAYPHTAFMVRYWRLLTAAFAPILVSITAIVSVIRMRALTAAAVSGAVALGCLLMGYVSFLSATAIGVRVTVLWGALGLLVLAFAWLAAAVFRRSLARRRVRHSYALGVCVLLIGLCALPSPLCRLYLTRMISPGKWSAPTWFRHPLGSARLVRPACASPRWFAMKCENRFLRWFSPTAIVDIETGRVRWLAREAVVYGPKLVETVPVIGLGFSPDGRRFAWANPAGTPVFHTLFEGISRRVGGLIDGRTRTYWRRVYRGRLDLCVCGLDTGRVQRFPGRVSPHVCRLKTVPIPTPLLWVDSSHLCGLTPDGETVAFEFTDVRTGETRCCPIPGTMLHQSTDPDLRNQEQAIVFSAAPNRAALAAVYRFRCKQGTQFIPGRMFLARATPADSAASIVRNPDLLGIAERFSFRAPPRISSDGEWALAYSESEYERAPRSSDGPTRGIGWLIRPATGTVREVFLPKDCDAPSAGVEVWFRKTEFGNAGKTLVFLLPRQCAVYRIADRAWDAFPTPPNGPTQDKPFPDAHLSPDGKRAFFLYPNPNAVFVLDFASGVWKKTLLSPGTFPAKPHPGENEEKQKLRGGYVPSAGWFGNDHILWCSRNSVWIVGLDGSNRRVLHIDGM